MSNPNNKTNLLCREETGLTWAHLFSDSVTKLTQRTQSFATDLTMNIGHVGNVIWVICFSFCSALVHDSGDVRNKPLAAVEADLATSPAVFSSSVCPPVTHAACLSMRAHTESGKQQRQPLLPSEKPSISSQLGAHVT